MILLIIKAFLGFAAVVFAYEIYLHFIKPRLSPKEIAMLTQDEQAIVDGVKALLTKVSGSDQAVTDANARATAAEAALAAEKADHAELVTTLQAVISPTPPANQP